MPNPLKARNLFIACEWCGEINCHRPHEGKTCRCYICAGVPTAAQFKKALRYAYRALGAFGAITPRKRIREILGDWR